MDNDLLQTDARNGWRMPIASVTLYWIPLGSGQSVVRGSGKVFEAISALIQRRRPCDLYHSALAVIVPEGRFVIEMAPIPDPHGERRGKHPERPTAPRSAMDRNGDASIRVPVRYHSVDDRPRRHRSADRRRPSATDKAREITRSIGTRSLLDFGPYHDVW